MQQISSWPPFDPFSFFDGTFTVNGRFKLITIAQVGPSFFLTGNYNAAAELDVQSLTVLPEPSTALLSAFSLFGLLRRKR